MSIDLVGRLHRTVYVHNCPPGSYEDLARLMMTRCGEVEEWEVLEETKRLVIAFQSVNSVSNALVFNGISYLDFTKKLVVWRAKDPPPPEVPQQLAITSSAGAGDGTGNDEDAKLNEEKAREEWLKQRRQRQLSLRELAGAMEEAHMAEVQGRDEKMMSFCYRQAKALTIILQDAIAKLQKEVQEQEVLLDATTALLGPSASTGGGLSLPQPSTSLSEGGSRKRLRN